MPFHKGCNKQRSWSDKFANASGLGMDEPFAYLGCWLRGPRQDPEKYKDAEYHMKWGKPKEPDKKVYGGPSVAEVKAYAVDMSWTPREGP